MTYGDVATVCLGFSQAVTGQTALIGSLSPEQTVASARDFIYATGIPRAELAATARICLGNGYGLDEMEMGSALVLVASGETAYGELLGHHLREG